jgi:hypothetical protein
LRVAKTEQRAIGALFGYHALQRLHENRGLQNTSERHVRGVFGDGEMDEPESIGGLTLAAREGLDNLTFIINCNLQRLDGPVRGDGQISSVGIIWSKVRILIRYRAKSRICSESGGCSRCWEWPKSDQATADPT